MKVYVHHFYSENLFYLLAHNTTDREYNLIDNLVGSIKCKYKGIDINFIFNPKITDEEDGYHLIDYTTTRAQCEIDDKFNLIAENKRKDLPDLINNGVNNTLYNLTNIVKNKTNWIFTFFNGEKTLYRYENVENYKVFDLLFDIENSLLKLNNCKIITEEFFLKDEIESKYPNFFYTFSNSMWYWNIHAEIRWYYEFKNIYNNLNFKYDLSYSMRSYKYHRILLLNELNKIKNNKLFIQRSDARKESEEYIKFENKVSHIYLNSEIGNTDFENLRIVNKQRVGLDLFFRMLPLSKMHILDESWAFAKTDFGSHYLSEKTIGFILAGIPFISTHSYPLKIVEKLLGVPPHPFVKESQIIQANEKLISSFIENFLDNFEENYIKCKNWIDICHSKIIEKINNENSLIDLVANKFVKTAPFIKKVI